MRRGLRPSRATTKEVQAFQNSKADYESSVALTATQKQELDYYQIRAPFAGIVGDVPVHVGDYVSPTTVLTTIDENADLEAYIYIPTDRAGQVRMGLPVELLGNDGSVVARSTISFLSPQVDNGLQSILAKASIPRSQQMLRNSQLCERTRDLEHRAKGHDSYTRRCASGRTAVCLCRGAEGRRICGAPGCGHAGRYGGQYLPCVEWFESWR